MGKLRVIFFGMASETTMAPLRAVAARHEVVGVVEARPRRTSALGAAAGRLMGSPLARFAASAGVPHVVMTRENGQRIAQFATALRPDVGCVSSFPMLLPEGLLTIPAKGFVNVHASLLPKFRGPNPLFWTYWAMEPEGGVTVHYMDAGEDTGAILAQAGFPMALGVPPEVLMARIRELGAELLVQALGAIADGTAEPVAQNHRPCPLRARRIAPGEALIDWRGWPIERVYHVLAAGRLGHQRLAGPWGRFVRPSGFERRASPLAPGAVGLDGRGLFVAHPQGRIRLSLRKTGGTSAKLAAPAPDIMM